MANKLTSMVDIVADNRQIFVEEYRNKIIEECAQRLELAAQLSSNSANQEAWRHAAEIVRALKDQDVMTMLEQQVQLMTQTIKDQTDLLKKSIKDRDTIIEECARAVECFSFVITIEEIAKAVRALKDKL